MTKIIFDTNIYFSAIGWDGDLLDIVNDCFANSDIAIFSSENISQELSLKLKSDKFFKLTKNKISPDLVQQTLKAIIEDSTAAEINIKINVCRDPNDNKFLELAKTVGANFLITGDRDLLILKEFEGTKILKPSKFLEQMQK